MDWRSRAACLGADPELFFPIGSGVRADAQAALAKGICAQCPVVGRCLDWALLNGYEGVWGGTDENERRTLTYRPVAVRGW